MTFNNKVNFSSNLIAFGLFASVAYHAIMGLLYKYPYPFNTFLFRPQDRFMDFYWPYTINRNPYVVARADFQNFPVLYKLASMFNLLNISVALKLFLFFFIIGFLTINIIETRGKTNRINLFATVSFSFLSYPAIFAFDRANFEIVVFFLLYIYVRLYETHPITSCASLGLAIALKGFPAILAILLLADKRYRELVISGFIALSLTLASYSSFPGGFSLNITNHLRNLSLYNFEYAIRSEGLPYGNSLFGGLKFGMQIINPTLLATDSMNKIIIIYTIIALLIFFSLSAFVVLVSNIFWIRVTLLICALNLLPPVSGDYKLLHIFIPLYLFLNIEKTKFDRILIILFSLLLIPKSYWTLPNFPDVSLNVLLNPLVLLSIIVLVVLKQKYFFSEN